MATTNTRYSLEIVSDTICPWCYIGKRRLDAALKLIGEEIAFEIHWRPFELNPDMPREGVDRKTYRSRKFGSWEKSCELDAQVKAAGAEDGLDFRHERIERTPNTLASHVLIRLAGEFSLQSEVAEALFKAYFTDGLDVGKRDVLIDIGSACGLDRTPIAAALDDEALRAELKAEALAFAQSGISGVPTVLLNRYILFSGAQAPTVIADALCQAAGHEAIIAAGRAAVTHA